MIGKFLSSQFSGYIALIGIAATIGLVWYIYNEGKVACKTAQTQVIVEKVKEYEEKKVEVRKLDDDDLVKRYCHWVYGMPYDECVSTYTFVP